MRKTVIATFSVLLAISLMISALPVSAENYFGWEAIRPLLKDGDGAEFVKTIDGLPTDYFSAGTEFEAVQLAATWVAENMKYKSDIEQYGYAEVWTSSDQIWETLEGDCEDYAILLCALLRFHTQGGIPAKRVWVIVGLVTEPGKGVIAGHAWVGYKMERGGILYIEPQLGILFRGNLPSYGGHMLMFNDEWVKGGGPYLAGSP